MTFTTPLRSVSLAAVLAAAALAGAGCGDSDSSASSSTNGSSSSQDAARVKLAQCLRKNGVDVPDNPGQGGARSALQDVDQAKLQAAMKTCQKYQRDAFGDVNDAQRQEFRDAFTKFASCMRQHGVEVPDIGSSAAPPASGAQIDRSDPRVKAAQKACQDKLPQGGPGGLGRGGS